MTFLNSVELGAKGQRTLPAAAYCDATVFSREQSAIFESRWVVAGVAAELAGPSAFMVKQIGKESILVVRDETGTIRAHFNHCRHRGTELCSEASGQLRRTIQCPYHAWTYGLDGKLVGVPDEDQMEDFCRADFGLHSAVCHEWDGLIWVNLNPQPEDFTNFIAPLVGKFTPWNLPQLVKLGERNYDVAANWKLIVQNYSECYHCAVIHPGLVRLSPPKSGGNDLVEGPFLGGFMDVTEPGGSLTCSGRACGAPVGDLTGDHSQRVYYYVLFPNVLLSLHHDYVMVHTLWPLAPDRTKIECVWLFHESSRDQTQWNPEDGIAFWDQTNREDWDICERTQRGVSSSRYESGPYSNREAMAAAFDRYYLRIMQSPK